MQQASRFLGIEVGSTNPVFLSVLAVHVLAGLTAVVAGAVAALSGKGGTGHVRFGRHYYRAICVVFGTATILAVVRWHENYQLFLIGAIAFAAASIGYLHRRRHRAGDAPHITGMGLSYIAMLTAFYVDNGPHLPLWDRLPTVAYWVLPTFVGGPIVIRALRNARRQAPPPTVPAPHQ